MICIAGTDLVDEKISSSRSNECAEDPEAIVISTDLALLTSTCPCVLCTVYGLNPCPKALIEKMIRIRSAIAEIYQEPRNTGWHLPGHHQ